MRHLSDDGAVDGLGGEDVLVLNAGNEEAAVATNSDDRVFSGS
jgi:hypothetical protein